MGSYQYRPLVVDAVQLDAAGVDPSPEVVQFLDCYTEQWESDRDEGIALLSSDGAIRVDPGDWVVRDFDGALRRFTPAAFEEAFEPIREIPDAS